MALPARHDPDPELFPRTPAADIEVEERACNDGHHGMFEKFAPGADAMGHRRPEIWVRHFRPWKFGAESASPQAKAILASGICVVRAGPKY
jgi:hypothetical protein